MKEIDYENFHVPHFFLFFTPKLRSRKLLISWDFVKVMFYAFLISLYFIKKYVIYLKDRGEGKLCTKFLNTRNSSFNPKNACMYFVCFSQQISWLLLYTYCVNWLGFLIEYN
jgi:hypothetical protein